MYIMQPGRRVVCLLPLLLSPALARQGDRLSVYGPVPGLAPSPYYRLQVRQQERQEEQEEQEEQKEQEEQAWRDTFTLLTECTAEKFCNTTGVSRHLNNWSNSYVNFQMEEGVRQGLNHEKSMELFVQSKKLFAHHRVFFFPYILDV